jgi:hypothetical protein
MGISIYEALVVIGLGVIGLIGSIQMQNQLGAMGITEAVGPAKWTGVISLILIVCGIIPAIGLLLKRKSTDISPGTHSTSSNVTVQGMMLMSLLGVWVAAASTLGYNIGNMCILPMIFYVAGFRPWFKSIAAGFIMTVVFYVTFVLGAKLSVPKGVFGLL